MGARTSTMSCYLSVCRPIGVTACIGLQWCRKQFSSGGGGGEGLRVGQQQTTCMCMYDDAIYVCAVCGRHVCGLSEEITRFINLGHGQCRKFEGNLAEASASCSCGGGPGGLLFICLFVYLFIFKFSLGSCLGCLNAIYGPARGGLVYELATLWRVSASRDVIFASILHDFKEISVNIFTYRFGSLDILKPGW